MPNKFAEYSLADFENMEESEFQQINNDFVLRKMWLERAMELKPELRLSCQKLGCDHYSHN